MYFGTTSHARETKGAHEFTNMAVVERNLREEWRPVAALDEPGERVREVYATQITPAQAI